MKLFHTMRVYKTKYTTQEELISTHKTIEGANKAIAADQKSMHEQYNKINRGLQAPELTLKEYIMAMSDNQNNWEVVEKELLD